ncbi:hypothetical protein P43SY_004824 [Pythium insidiosum]|uniref:C2 domain-containing protein n=1 Tax=Pythium insidiosum TaxID=114742 RepID=A0AAD5M4A7_PYTIN|nr:hypothetical protein P43SY_004824 [Pythium insidiosum]
MESDTDASVAYPLRDPVSDQRQGHGHDDSMEGIDEEHEGDASPLVLQDDALLPHASCRRASAAAAPRRTHSAPSRRRGRSDGDALTSSSPSVPYPSSTCSSSVRSVSTVDLRHDQELLAQALLQSVSAPASTLSLDLSLTSSSSSSSSRSRRPLKSLLALRDDDVIDATARASLRQLHVSGHALSSLAGIEVLPDLESFSASRNHLKRIDSALFSLTSLRELDLSGNFISQLPRGISALRVLESLNLAGNNLAALKEVDALAPLSNLHACQLAANPFCKLPTYRDYVIAKLATLERLDDHAVTPQQRDKSRRRFSDERFAKDQFVRDADRAHADEQQRLLDAQSALEAENQRLRGELQLKSKLLQNKSKAWTTATEQLVQLQQEFAMLNLDRRALKTTAVLGGDKDKGEEEEEQEHAVGREKPHVAFAEDAAETAPEPGENQRDDVLHVAPTAPRSPERRVMMIDSAVSPFPPSRVSPSPSQGKLITPDESWNSVDWQSHRSVSTAPSSQSPRQSPTRKGRAPAVSTFARDMLEHEDDDPLHPPTHRLQRDALGSLVPQLPTFEDDAACPAYEDASVPPVVPFPRVCKSPSRRQLRHGGRSPTGRSAVMSLVDKENLARQIQALQSCRQTLVQEIASEEQLLHALKRERAAYADEMARLESDLDVLLSVESAGLETVVDGTARVLLLASRPREEETLRAKLDVLRNKLHFAEDKEKEIEASIVRLTKRVLEHDLRLATPLGSSAAMSTSDSTAAFDREIHALTHKLQLVIVQKEEIHSEMSRVLAQLKAVAAVTASATAGGASGLSSETVRLLEQQQRRYPSSGDPHVVFLEQQQRLKDVKQRHQDVADRVAVKESLVAELVAELKDVDAELAYINGLTPRSPAPHRRAVSLDSQSGASLAELARDSEGTAAGERRSRSRPASPVRCSAPSGTALSAPALASLSADHGNATAAAAEDVQQQFAAKLQELFNDDVMKEIKREVLDKLAGTRAVASLSSHKELQDAIAQALETHLKGAMSHLASGSVSRSPASSPPKTLKTGDAALSKRSDDEAFWDQLDEFLPVDATYKAKYRFIRERTAAFSSSSSSSASSARVAALQRIIRAGERLEQASVDCRVDPISSIEVDGAGRKRSALQVLVMAARDLPTAHLRTKNLDPYVALEVVYPEHLRPLADRQPPVTSLLPHRPDAADSRLRSELPGEATSVRTRTVKKSVFPVWDQAFELAPIESLKGYLHVRVLNDRKLSREQLVGEAKVPLRLLVHQRRVVETLALRVEPPASSQRTWRRGSSDASSAVVGGQIRVQLQLSFSRIEKAKRTLDDLVTKYLHEHNQLPPFIESTEPTASLLEQAPESPTAQATTAPESSSDTGDGALPTFETWKAQQSTATAATATARTADITHSSAAAPPSSPPRAPSPSPPLSATPVDSIFEAPRSHTVLSSARSAALWAPESATKPRPDISAKASRPTLASSSASSSRNAMAPLRSETAKPSRLASVHPSSSAAATMLRTRRKTELSTAPAVPTSSASRRPECFDEYSPYHPDFQLLDPLDLRGDRGGTVVYSKPRVSSGAVAYRGDLRIFKSPAFGRREPSGSFPERFIGLDSQTSERIKRIFGRIDTAT